MTRHPPIGAENCQPSIAHLKKKKQIRGVCDEAISAVACGFNLGPEMDLGRVLEKGTKHKTYLVQVIVPQLFDNLLSLSLRQPPLRRNNFPQCCIDLPCHMRCVTADVEVSPLREQLIDFLCVFG